MWGYLGSTLEQSLPICWLVNLENKLHVSKIQWPDPCCQLVGIDISSPKGKRGRKSTIPCNFKFARREYSIRFQGLSITLRFEALVSGLCPLGPHKALALFIYFFTGLTQIIKDNFPISRFLVIEISVT